jgi:SAM-dependent methyltransferase
MDERTNKVAALANAAIYDSEATRKYIDGAPHIKHSTLRQLYSRLVVTVYDFASRNTSTPKVLDLGAGEGSVTLPFLELGARVTAVDFSESQLNTLQEKCADYAGQLEILCQDVFDAIESIQSDDNRYDIVVANSFLHHIPDYLSLIRKTIVVLTPYGQFFSFQDPLRYDSVGRFTISFNALAYFSWRIFKSDLVGGIRRRIRRARGIYLPDCPDDNVEYHVMRGGVDQNAIKTLFDELGFECEIIPYFSTQSRLWQPIGTALGIKSTFAMIARKTPLGV